MIRASAPGKLILCGEHAVVYGQPAIALPVAGVAATATISAADTQGIIFDAPQLGERWRLDEQPVHPLTKLVQHTLALLELVPQPAITITLESTIPIASGMGSGAALGAALVRALATYAGKSLDPTVVSELVYESERFYHGTPSGIDNTVVSFGRPIWYQRDRVGATPTIEPLEIGTELIFVIGDTGRRCPTKITVGGVRDRATADPTTYEAHFAAIGRLVHDARTALRYGDLPAIAALLNEDHRLLQIIGVSSPELDHLIEAARNAGAAGAKLSGGGGGGIMLALATASTVEAISTALEDAGATQVIVTHLSPTAP